MFSTSNIERCLFKIFTSRNQTGPGSKISRPKRDLIIKLITWIDEKSRDESIKTN